VADRIELRMQDYRELTGQYDKLVSVEMIEAVGHKFYPAFFAACDRLLKPTGRGLIQAITIADQRYDAARKCIDFIKKYVFPGSCIPSITVLNQAMARGSSLRMTHLEDLTPHYATTLHHWHQRMIAARGEILALGYPEELLRMWAFYLAYCEGGFIERNIGLVHFEMRKPGCEDPPLTLGPGCDVHALGVSASAEAVAAGGRML
jgi:cyclopropane-fatty-acyl-phospholipid synthase